MREGNNIMRGVRHDRQEEERGRKLTEREIGGEGESVIEIISISSV